MHHGTVRAAFQMEYVGSYLSYATGQAIAADDALKAAIEASEGADVAWASEAVAEGLLSFDQGDAPMAVEAMRPGVIYQADRFDKEAARGAFEAGQVSNVTVASKRDGQAHRMHGYTLAG